MGMAPMSGPPMESLCAFLWAILFFRGEKNIVFKNYYDTIAILPMHNTQKKKLAFILILVLMLSSAVGLVLYALKQNINLFYTPTQLRENSLVFNKTIRLGGYVEQHSVHYESGGTSVRFLITDRTNTIEIIYHGMLPNLFREGQGVVVTGKFNGHYLKASEVLAKHDEKYMPPNILKTIEKKHDA